MSKLSVEDLAEVLRASQRMHGHPEERVDALIQAVRAEAEARVWGLIEKVLDRADGWHYLSKPSHRWTVEKLRAAGSKILGDGPTAREAILAAAKELGIDTEVQS